jgi:hypothetical protein
VRRSDRERIVTELLDGLEGLDGLDRAERVQIATALRQVAQEPGDTARDRSYRRVLFAIAEELDERPGESLRCLTTSRRST